MARKTRTFPPEDNPVVRYEPDGSVYVDYGVEEEEEGE